MALRTAKALGLVAVVVGVGLGGVLVVGALVSWITGEPSGLRGEAIGIARIDGTLAVVSCRDSGIGAATIASGNSPSSQVVWSVTSTGLPAAMVPIQDSVPGYVVQSSAKLESGRTYALTKLTNGAGVNNLGSIVIFDPVEIHDGQVLTGEGVAISIAEFTERATGCVLN